MRGGRAGAFRLTLVLLTVGLILAAGPGIGQQRRLRRARIRPSETAARDYLDAQGRPRPDLLRLGIQHVRRMPVALAGTAPHPLGYGSPGAIPQWNPIGPQPLIIDAKPPDMNALFQGAGPDSGQVVDVAIDPRGSADRVIYIATNGGVWKSADGGQTWRPKTDFTGSLSIGCVTVDPFHPDTVYAGTGNPQHLSYSGYLFPGYWFVKGIGIYRSEDGGENWSLLGESVFQGLTIYKILVARPGTLLVASSGGLFRSEDGGRHFGRNAPRFNNALPLVNGAVTDLDRDPERRDVFYAASTRFGLLRSTDGGATFPVNLFAHSEVPIPGDFGYISFSQSVRPNNRTMFASIGNRTTSPRFMGLYLSTDAGATWSRALAGDIACEDPDLDPDEEECSAGYTQTVGVDPQDPNRVYVGFEQLWLSTDGGLTSYPISRYKLHWDHHALVFSPSSHRHGPAPTPFWAGTDGGVHFTTDGGDTFANLNDGIATNLFVGIDVSRRSGTVLEPRYTYGGTQDCGTIEHRADHAPLQWHLAQDCDGLNVAVDPFNPLQAYGIANYLNFLHTTDGGDNWNFPPPSINCDNPPGLPCDGTLLTLNVDPNDSARVYVGQGILGGTSLFGSEDVAATFQTYFTFPAEIADAGMTRASSNFMWVGLDNGHVFHTTNLQQGPNSTWTDTGAPGGINPANLFAFCHVAVDPLDPSVAVAVTKGFTGIDPSNPTRHVFLTTDNGASWKDVSGQRGQPSTNVPDLPINDVVIDPRSTPHAIIIATDGGVLRTLDQGRTWAVLGLGLPNVTCRSLALNEEAIPPVLRVGTFGRSAFELGGSTGRISVQPRELDFGARDEARRLRVRDTGPGSLAVRLQAPAGFAIAGEGGSQFVLEPGEERTVTVRSGGPERRDVLRVLSSDPATPSVDVILRRRS